MKSTPSRESDLHQKRAEEVFRDFVENHRNKLVELDQGHSEINGLIQNLKEKVFLWVKKQCNESFHWIEEHGTVHYTDNGINVNIKENFLKEADTKLQEFAECTKNNDFNVKNYFDLISGDLSRIESQTENCVLGCFDKPNDKSDDELKLCVNQCYDKTFKD